MKKHIDSLLVLLLVIVFLFTLAGCASKDTITEPPVLTLQYGDTKIEAQKFGFSWKYTDIFGKVKGMDALAIHPLFAKEEQMSSLSYNPNLLKILLQFPVEPDSISVECWNEQYWHGISGDTNVPFVEGEEIPVNSFSIELKDGGNIYLVIATWEKEKYSGTVYYSFYAVPAEV
ncbi:MAG TPA: hypothetical protein VJZ69_04505 [Clostridia bacterium]|nr:hypothetical protein [Clostridia bacterium]